MVLRINRSSHNPGHCRWCVEPTVGTHIVSRQDWSYRWVSDYACCRCADGWQEISDLNSPLIV